MRISPSVFGGRLILRIEDIDITRCRPEYDAAIIRDLAWLGLRFDEPIRRQSQHFDDYRLLLRRLREAGLVYPCFATRKEIAQAVAAREAETGSPAPRDPDGAPLYPRLCAGLDPAEAQARIEAGEPFALRIDMAKALAEAARIAPEGLAYARFDREGNIARVPADPARWGDAVIMRKEIPTSYHLAVVHDDAGQGVTHVVRGRDLEAATDLHVLLQCLIGLPTPLYHHHDLIRDESGDKARQEPRLDADRAIARRGRGSGGLAGDAGIRGLIGRHAARYMQSSIATLQPGPA